MELQLKPGDCILYHTHDWWGWFLRVKTWSAITHVEVYAGNGKSVASRPGKNVNLYPFRAIDISFVLRPKLPLLMDYGMAWFKSVQGRPYDWWGLLRFFRIGSYSDNKMFCSEFAVNFYRACGFQPFAEQTEPDQISPGMFLDSTEFDRTYQTGE